MKKVRKLTKAEEERLEAKVLEAHKRFNTVEGKVIKCRVGNNNGLTHKSIPVRYEDEKIREVDMNPFRVNYVGALTEDKELDEINFEIGFEEKTVYAVYDSKKKFALECAFQDREWLVNSMINCYQVGWDRPKMNIPKKRKEIK